MKILSIETSCDETGIAVLECQGTIKSPEFNILGNSLYSQVDIHKEYGGVFPNLARREHAKNLVPLLIKTLKESGLYDKRNTKALVEEAKLTRLKEILIKEPDLYNLFVDFLIDIEKPDIDLIAVTQGPGLAPALWVGINFAEALRCWWDIPVLPVNHMEGHIWSILMNKENKVEFPALALLVSGGHTELVYIKNYKEFDVIGRTRDDAVGEAYDKVARLLSLPYPGGPQISRLADNYRSKQLPQKIFFPEPMASSPDFDFSYSGLKTAVLYKLKEFPEITDGIREEIAHAFEQAAINVLIKKTQKAIEALEVKTLIVGGGVVANRYLRERINSLKEVYPHLNIYIPEMSLATDNAIMIGMSAYLETVYNNSNKTNPDAFELKAQGNLSL